MARSRCVRTGRPAFTLTELMVAVVVLVGILLAVSKIFSTTSKVTSVGEATADVLQEAAAIERQLRNDLARLAPEGLVAIRCVAVPNNFYALGGGPLLNSSLAPDAMIRADQLMFFTNGVQSVQTSKLGWGANHKGQGTVARVYYGHAFQLGDAGRPVDGLNTDPPLPRAFDVDQLVFPWANSRFDGPINMVRTLFESGGQSNDIFNVQAPSTLDIAPVDARKWVLARQPIVMVDDDHNVPGDNSKTSYLGQVLTGRSLFLTDPVLGATPQVLTGRVDAAALQMDDLRNLILFDGNRARPWRQGFGATLDQFTLISQQLLYYPRAERYAPSGHRIDQALTNHVLGSACSSVRIDWTYDDGVGFAIDGAGNQLLGVIVDPDLEQPWFGMSDNVFNRPEERRGVFPYGGEVTWTMAQTTFADNIERFYTIGGGGVEVYEAFFGFNHDTPLDATGMPTLNLGYTPWPSAIRVTLTLHDPATTLEGGREVQFVLDLPRRTASRP